MKTTIIIPNYNGLSFMEPCFEALEAQTMKDFKILWWTTVPRTAAWSG